MRGKLAGCNGADVMQDLLLKPAIFAAAALVALNPAMALQGGALKTLPQGVYQCALPGDAAGAAWRPVEGMDFTIINASSYESDLGRGTYLLKGDRLIFTRGPLKGLRLKRQGDYTLRALETDTSLGAMRCVRLGAGV